MPIRLDQRSLAASLAVAAVVTVLPSGPALGQGALTNESVLRLARSGVPDDVIIAEIRRVPTRFDVSGEALDRLRAAGVPAAVLAAMREATAGGAATRAVAPDVWTRLGLAVGGPTNGVGDERQRIPGVLVSGVRPRGAAASVGVQRGDLVTHVNGVRVRSAAQAVRTIEDAGPAQTTALTLLRGARELSITVPPADGGDIALPPPWPTRPPAPGASAVPAADGGAGPAARDLTLAARAPPGPRAVSVDLAIRFLAADASPPTVVTVALVDGDVTVRETLARVDGQTVRASFVGPTADVPTGRRYLVDITTALGRRHVATLDLREATAPVSLTLDAPAR